MNSHEQSIHKLPTPLHLFTALLIIISSIEALVHFCLPLIIPDSQKNIQVIADALLLTFISAPFIWKLIAVPLRAAVMTEFSRTNAVLKTIVEAVICFNEEGTIESLNPAAEKMFGYQPREIIGQHISKIIPAMTDGSNTSQKAVELQNNITTGFETSGCHIDGTPFPLEISISAVKVGDRALFIAIIHDISQRKRAEALLEEQKDFSFRLVQNFAVPCFVLAPDHTVLVWNKACEELTGLKHEELIGTNEHWKAFYDHKRPTLADVVLDCNSKNIAVNCEKYARSAFAEDGFQYEDWYPNVGGRRRYLFFDAVPVRNALGEVIAVIETLEDITERQEAEESLRVSKEKFSKAFHAAPDGIVINSKAEGYFIEANEAFFSMLGYTRDEVIGHSSLELGLWVDPGQRRQIIERTERERAVRNVEIRIRIKSGQIRTFLWSSDTITYDGVECLIVTVRDITVQKDNEQNLLKSRAELIVKHEQLSILFSQVEAVKKEWERTMDCIKDMVILLDWKGKVKRCNHATVEFLEVPYDKIFGQDWQRLMQAAGTPANCSIDGFCEFYHEKTDRWFSLTYYTENENGAYGMVGSVVTIHDTSETKRAAMELEQAYTELKETHAQMLQQEKMASIGQLAAGVAHEINNPTGFIISNLGTLRKYAERLVEFSRAQSEIISLHGKSGEEKLAPLRTKLKIDRIIDDIPNLISESLDGADRMKRIVKDMKSFSRMDGEECKIVNLTDYIESTINIVWNEIKYKAALKRDYGELPAIKCHPQQLSQVFMNLLVNAAHAIQAQGEITVRTWQESNFVFISVADTGCGIPEKIRNRIFEPFFTTKEVGKGTGLGLSISYDIIKNHGGDISVDSAL
ncbi:MAG: PAS domain S-box protein, partial [Steroidobacteraceae bacterium]|nr:PAS domain S-box protein [Deltaproteobacteria bacterium]